MAAKRKRWKRPVLEGLTMEELQEERMKEVHEAMAKFEPNMDEIR